MQIRASLLTLARVAAVGGAIAAVGACTHASANLMVDVPRILPYQAPDIDEITGIDSEEADEASDAAGTGSGSARTPHK